MASPLGVVGRGAVNVLTGSSRQNHLGKLNQVWMREVSIFAAVAYRRLTRPGSARPARSRRCRCAQWSRAPLCIPVGVHLAHRQGRRAVGKRRSVVIRRRRGQARKVSLERRPRQWSGDGRRMEPRRHRVRRVFPRTTPGNSNPLCCRAFRVPRGGVVGSDHGVVVDRVRIVQAHLRVRPGRRHEA